MATIRFVSFTLIALIISVYMFALLANAQSNAAASEEGGGAAAAPTRRA